MAGCFTSLLALFGLILMGAGSAVAIVAGQPATVDAGWTWASVGLVTLIASVILASRFKVGSTRLHAQYGHFKHTTYVNSRTGEELRPAGPVVCILWSLILGTFAVIGYQRVGVHPANLVLALGLGSLGVIMLLTGLSRVHLSRRSRVSASVPVTPTAADNRTQYHEFRWGTPPPTKAQFDYVMLHGGRPRDGLTRHEFDTVVERIQSSLRPATAEQMKLMWQMRGSIPPGIRISEAQADAIIERLQDIDWKCHRCGFIIDSDRLDTKKCDDCKADVSGVEVDIRSLGVL